MLCYRKSGGCIDDVLMPHKTVNSPLGSQNQTVLWDDRTHKHNLDSPKFRHRNTAEILKTDNGKSRQWIKEASDRKTLQVIGGGSFQGHNGAHNAGTAGNVVCNRLPLLSEAKDNLTDMIGGGDGLQTFEKNALMNMYVKSGSMIDARRVFDSMPKRNVVSWNMMILGYAKYEEGALALDLYARMCMESVQPTHRTFVSALKACCSLAALEDAKQVDGRLVKRVCLENGRAVHSQVVKSGFGSDVFVETALVDMYSKCGSMDDAQYVFDEMPHRNVVSWTAMISGYAHKEEGHLALELCERMCKEGVTADHRAFVASLKACSTLATGEELKQVDGKLVKISCLEKCRAIHFQAVKSGFELDVFVGTALVDTYVKCESMEDARHVFDDLPRRDVVSWNSMILGYAQKEAGAVALELYVCMRKEGVIPDDRTFVSASKACSDLAKLEERKQVDGKFVKIGCLEKGKAIHFQVVKSSFEEDVYVGTTLVDMYATCGSMEDARHVFDKLLHRNVVSWNAMLWGYVEQEESEKALKLHAQMQELGLPQNSVTFMSILKACGNAAALETGKELHAQICEAGLETTTIVASALTDMYAKCGSMIDAQKFFDALPTPELVTWNALIAGYARQGESDLVFHLFDRMEQEGRRANEVTFLSVLNVCSHNGLLDKGQKYFRAMSKQYGVHPTIEHYTCMIDLLGRTGQLEEAVAMVQSMPFKADVVSWLAVLGACRKWKNVEVGQHAFEQAMRLDENSSAAYVLMSNLYAHAHMWDDFDKIQAMRKNLHTQKKQGQSRWTDGNGMVHALVDGDTTSHPQSKEIHSKLKDISDRMEEGHVPNWDCVLQEDSSDIQCHFPLQSTGSLNSR